MGLLIDASLLDVLLTGEDIRSVSGRIGIALTVLAGPSGYFLLSREAWMLNPQVADFVDRKKSAN
jgi:hypothetical protein